MIVWLEKNTPFPLEATWPDLDGLICAGGDLSPERLVNAYRQGIFPWYSPGDPILWWSLDPRMVLFPKEFRLHRSLKKTLRHSQYQIRLDTAFSEVIHACATAPRPGQNGSWISPEMIAAYTHLHELGIAHSVETWTDGRLQGGLYGIALGRMFFGESMFARCSNASKIALAHLVRFLDTQEFGLIDCQMNTAHLGFHGGREIPRKEFLIQVRSLIDNGAPPARWKSDAAVFDWSSQAGRKANEHVAT